MDQTLPADPSLTESLKTWAVEVLAKKMLPSLLKGALVFVLAYLAAHAGILAKIGVSVVGNTIVLNLDTLQATGGALLMGLLTALLTAAQHHTVAAVTGAPQSGDMRSPLQTPLGRRSDDPPTETPSA